jgi:hypothetical protein
MAGDSKRKSCHSDHYLHLDSTTRNEHHVGRPKGRSVYGWTELS